MARFTEQNVQRALELIGLYPEARSAMIPPLHLAQEQDGWVSPDAMEHIAELLDTTPSEVIGTCSFYTMFKREPVGKHLISVCTNIACLLNGGYELLEHAESTLGIRPGATTADGQFTLEEAECLAACGEAPCLQVDYRFFGNVTDGAFDSMVDELRSGQLDEQIPSHGTLCRVRREVGSDRSSLKAAMPPPPRAAGAARRLNGPAVTIRTGNDLQAPNKGAIETAARDAEAIESEPKSDRPSGSEGGDD